MGDGSGSSIATAGLSLAFLSNSSSIARGPVVVADVTVSNDGVSFVVVVVVVVVASRNFWFLFVEW
jgi:hypothetical protein